MSSSLEFVVDPKIRDWVFLPIIYVTITVGMIRMYYTQYSNNTKTKEKVQSDDKANDLQEKRILAKCQKLQKNNIYLTEDALSGRKAFLCRPETGYLRTCGKEEAENDPTKAMMDQQGQMFGTMKGTLVMGVVMMLQMAWVNYFFNGFVLAKVPFPLTQKFRGMTQNSVDMENLDVRYVSALSFYFVIMFGMSPLMTFLMDNPSESQDDMVKPDPMGGMGGGPGAMPGMGMPGMGGGMGGMFGGMGGAQNTGSKKLFQAELENIELIHPSFAFKNIEDVALSTLKRRLKS